MFSALSAARRHSSRRFSSMPRVAAASAFIARISSFSRPMRVTGLYSEPSRSARRAASRSIAFARYPRCLVGSSSSPLSALLRWLTRSSNPFLSRAALTQSAHSLRRSTSSSRPAFLASFQSGLTIDATGFLLFRSALSRPTALASDMVRRTPSLKLNTFSYPSGLAHAFQSAASTHISGAPALRQR